MKKIIRLAIAFSVLMLLVFYTQIVYVANLPKLLLADELLLTRQIVAIACTSWILIEIVRLLKRRLLSR